MGKNTKMLQVTNFFWVKSRVDKSSMGAEGMGHQELASTWVRPSRERRDDGLCYGSRRKDVEGISSQSHL